jgi:acid stress chaperone HdeA
MRSIVLSILPISLFVVPLGLACDKVGADSHEVADAAQSDLEKLRSEYRQQKQADLALLDRSITDLEGKEKAGSAKAKTELHRMLASLKAQREAFVADLGAADAASAATWDATRARLDKEWGMLKSAADKTAGTVASELAATYKPGEMSCEDFVALADVDRPKVVYWGEGFNKIGQPVDSVVDVDQIDRVVPVLVSECAKTPKALLSKGVQQHAATASKPAAAAPAPSRMTCEQFVMLDDVAKPKVVYWAEGFNVASDGGATDAVVDIETTDKLVPVLVTECNATPKLTLWQKIKKYI